MNDFYVIVGIHPNPATKDHISIAMIAWSMGTFSYQVSWQKVQGVSSMLNISKSNIEWVLRQIKDTLDQINKKIESSKGELIVRLSVMTSKNCFGSLFQPRQQRLIW
jgi:hypothetical protein